MDRQRFVFKFFFATAQIFKNDFSATAQKHTFIFLPPHEANPKKNERVFFSNALRNSAVRIISLTTFRKQNILILN